MPTGLSVTEADATRNNVVILYVNGGLKWLEPW